jgi:hypothetical protein
MSWMHIDLDLGDGVKRYYMNREEFNEAVFWKRRLPKYKTYERDMSKISIDDFIEFVYPRLKHNVSIGEERYTGAELMLTGAKEPEEGWDPRKIYTIKVPVVKEIDHRRNMRMAFLKSGKVGIREYLSKHLSAEDLEKVMNVI